MDNSLPPTQRRETGSKAPRRRRHLVVLGMLVTIAAGGSAALWWRDEPAEAAPPPGSGPGPFGATAPQSVAIAMAEKHDIPIILTGLGTVTPLATVTVKSQISGYLTKIDFAEGQMVRRGDLLAEVDPRPYEALLEQYQGALDRDKALLDNARLDLARYRKLASQDSISKQNVDTQAATVRQYEGTVRADQAQVDAEKLNLVYCRITAPVDGRVGLRQVDTGNYVTASDTDGIVVVTQVLPISVLFTVPEDAVPQIRARLHAGAKLTAAAYDRSNKTKLADGTLDTLDNEIDTTTGTLKLRALYPNIDDALFPNQFVNARLLVDTVHDAITVPLTAVQNGAQGSSVYLVDADNKAHLRKIAVGIADTERVAVTAGLALGDKVVTDGADRLRDGATVSIAPASITPASKS
jgi:membrane fusion protein, multidrug efflux system